MIYHQHTGERRAARAAGQPRAREGGPAGGVFTKQTHFGKTNPFSRPERLPGRLRPEPDDRSGFDGGIGRLCRRPTWQRGALGPRVAGPRSDCSARKPKLTRCPDLKAAVLRRGSGKKTLNSDDAIVVFTDGSRSLPTAAVRSNESAASPRGTLRIRAWPARPGRSHRRRPAPPA